MMVQNQNLRGFFLSTLMYYSSMFKSFLGKATPKATDLTSYVMRSFATTSIESKPKEELNVEEEIVELSPEEEHEQFLLARLAEHSRQSTQISLISNAPTISSSWFKDLQSSFQTAKTSFMGDTASKVEEDEYDWDFWGIVINDYENIIRVQPRQFQKHLHKGLPPPIRGMMWQLMSNSKNEQLEEEYLALILRSSRHEKIIQRDLARTFPKHEYFKEVNGPGQTALFNILKAYSLYDKEIGYCQGLPFVVGPLILNMPEEQAFCVLVRLMFDFNFRDLYTPKMIGLQLRNYQFDKLIEQQFPAVHRHLENQDIKSTMYASQWFMTLFAYRFPLELVYRILDVILAEGAEAVLRFALALIKHNADIIVTLDFEKLLEYLKEGLFDKYLNNMNQLVQDANKITISKRKLDKWSAEYLEQIRKQSPDYIEAEALRVENRKMATHYKILEQNYETLNREHIDLVNQYIKDKEIYDLQLERNEELQEQVNGFKTLLASDRNHAEEQVEVEMENLAARNIQLMKKNADLQEMVHELELKLLESRTELAHGVNEREELKDKLKTALAK
ncbi:rab-GTPase-TBC domain-containing protein [Globomyces pollinis-pini]|nr:rab-GTPase-TBC domain-containing protein [Globomyces pollinis-pini]